MQINRLVEVFFNWPVSVEAFPHLLSGLKTTVMMAVVTFLLASIAGLVIAVGRNMRVRWLDWLIIGYVDVFRSVPSLIVLIFIYFALPFVGMKLHPFTAAVVGLTLINSAFIAEIFRSGIEAVETGQIDAAHALGMTAGQTVWWIVLPQAFRIVIPPFTSNTVALIKDTALASAITVPDLLREAREFQSTHFNPSPLTAAALMYLVILVPLVRLTSTLERWARASR
jgi:polar amino acid transport system permease protein